MVNESLLNYRKAGILLDRELSVKLEGVNKVI